MKEESEEYPDLRMFFDGAANGSGNGVGAVLVSPQGPISLFQPNEVESKESLLRKESRFRNAFTYQMSKRASFSTS